MDANVENVLKSFEDKGIPRDQVIALAGGGRDGSGDFNGMINLLTQKVNADDRMELYSGFKNLIGHKDVQSTVASTNVAKQAKLNKSFSEPPKAPRFRPAMRRIEPAKKIDDMPAAERGLSLSEDDVNIIRNDCKALSDNGVVPFDYLNALESLVKRDINTQTFDKLAQTNFSHGVSIDQPVDESFYSKLDAILEVKRDDIERVGLSNFKPGFPELSDVLGVSDDESDIDKITKDLAKKKYAEPVPQYGDEPFHRNGELYTRWMSYVTLSTEDPRRTEFINIVMRYEHKAVAATSEWQEKATYFISKFAKFFIGDFELQESPEEAIIKIIQYAIDNDKNDFTGPASSMAEHRGVGDELDHDDRSGELETFVNKANECLSGLLKFAEGEISLDELNKIEIPGQKSNASTASSDIAVIEVNPGELLSVKVNDYIEEQAKTEGVERSPSGEWLFSKDASLENIKRGLPAALFSDAERGYEEKKDSIRARLQELLDLKSKTTDPSELQYLENMFQDTKAEWNEILRSRDVRLARIKSLKSAVGKVIPVKYKNKDGLTYSIDNYMLTPGGGWELLPRPRKVYDPLSMSSSTGDNRPDFDIPEAKKKCVLKICGEINVGAGGEEFVNSMLNKLASVKEGLKDVKDQSYFSIDKDRATRWLTNEMAKYASSYGVPDDRVEEYVAKTLKLFLDEDKLATVDLDANSATIINDEANNFWSPDLMHKLISTNNGDFICLPVYGGIDKKSQKKYGSNEANKLIKVVQNAYTTYINMFYDEFNSMVLDQDKMLQSMAIFPNYIRESELKDIRANAESSNIPGAEFIGRKRGDKDLITQRKFVEAFVNNDLSIIDELAARMLFKGNAAGELKRAINSGILSGPDSDQLLSKKFVAGVGIVDIFYNTDAFIRGAWMAVQESFDDKSNKGLKIDRVTGMPVELPADSEANRQERNQQIISSRVELFERYDTLFKEINKEKWEVDPNKFMGLFEITQEMLRFVKDDLNKPYNDKSHITGYKLARVVAFENDKVAGKPVRYEMRHGICGSLLDRLAQKAGMLENEFDKSFGASLELWPQPAKVTAEQAEYLRLGNEFSKKANDLVAGNQEAVGSTEHADLKNQSLDAFQKASALSLSGDSKKDLDNCFDHTIPGSDINVFEILMSGGVYQLPDGYDKSEEALDVDLGQDINVDDHKVMRSGSSDAMRYHRAQQLKREIDELRAKSADPAEIAEKNDEFREMMIHLQGRHSANKQYRLKDIRNSLMRRIDDDQKPVYRLNVADYILLRDEFEKKYNGFIDPHMEIDPSGRSRYRNMIIPGEASSDYERLKFAVERKAMAYAMVSVSDGLSQFFPTAVVRTLSKVGISRNENGIVLSGVSVPEWFDCFVNNKDYEFVHADSLTEDEVVRSTGLDITNPWGKKLTPGVRLKYYVGNGDGQEPMLKSKQEQLEDIENRINDLSKDMANVRKSEFAKKEKELKTLQIDRNEIKDELDVLSKGVEGAYIAVTAESGEETLFDVYNRCSKKLRKDGKTPSEFCGGIYSFIDINWKAEGGPYLAMKPMKVDISDMNISDAVASKIDSINGSTEELNEIYEGYFGNLESSKHIDRIGSSIKGNIIKGSGKNYITVRGKGGYDDIEITINDRQKQLNSANSKYAAYPTIDKVYAGLWAIPSKQLPMSDPAPLVRLKDTSQKGKMFRGQQYPADAFLAMYRAYKLARGVNKGKQRIDLNDNKPISDPDVFPDTRIDDMTGATVKHHAAGELDIEDRHEEKDKELSGQYKNGTLRFLKHSGKINIDVNNFKIHSENIIKIINNILQICYEYKEVINHKISIESVYNDKSPLDGNRKRYLKAINNIIKTVTTGNNKYPGVLEMFNSIPIGKSKDVLCPKCGRSDVSLSSDGYVCNNCFKCPTCSRRAMKAVREFSKRIASLQNQGADASQEITKRDKIKQALKDGRFDVKRTDFADWCACSRCNFVTNEAPDEDQFKISNTDAAEFVNIRSYKKLKRAVHGVAFKIYNMILSYDRLSATPAAVPGLGSRQSGRGTSRDVDVTPEVPPSAPAHEPWMYSGQADPEIVKSLTSGRQRVDASGNPIPMHLGKTLPTSAKDIESKWA